MEQNSSGLYRFTIESRFECVIGNTFVVCMRLLARSSTSEDYNPVSTSLHRVALKSVKILKINLRITFIKSLVTENTIIGYLHNILTCTKSILDFNYQNAEFLLLAPFAVNSSNCLNDTFYFYFIFLLLFFLFFKLNVDQAFIIKMRI